MSLKLFYDSNRYG